MNQNEPAKVGPKPALKKREKSIFIILIIRKTASK